MRIVTGLMVASITSCAFIQGASFMSDENLKNYLKASTANDAKEYVGGAWSAIWGTSPSRQFNEKIQKQLITSANAQNTATTKEADDGIGHICKDGKNTEQSAMVKLVIMVLPVEELKITLPQSATDLARETAEKHQKVFKSSYDKNDAAITKLVEEYTTQIDKQITTQERTYNTQTTNLKKQYDENEADITKKHEQEIANLRKAHEEELKKFKNTFEETEKARLAEHIKNKTAMSTSLESERDQKVGPLKAELNQAQHYTTLCVGTLRLIQKIESYSKSRPK